MDSYLIPVKIGSRLGENMEGTFGITLPGTINKPNNSLTINNRMDILEFFQLNSGKWFSQRTSHHLALNKSESGKSDIQIDLLAATDDGVIQLCHLHDIDPALAVLGMKTTWTGMMDQDTKKTTGSSLLVLIPTATTPHAGQLLQSQTVIGKPPTGTIAHYSLGSDQVLTVMTQSDTLYSDERIWFAGSNLRLRSSKVKRSGGFEIASFCSEIRMGGMPTTP